MFATILRKELRLALRAGRLWPLLAVWTLLAVLCAVASVAAQQRAQQEREAASESDRRAWEAQGARNPHSAAHFGQYAYKPVTALGALDPGIDAWLGASVWMEAHYQNPATQRVGEDLTPLSRMGALSFGWMLQVLLPLTILVLGFDLLAEERARGALKLQMVAGTSPAMLMLAKAAALLAASLLVTLPGWLAVPVLLYTLGDAGFTDGGARFALWLSTYGAYVVVWVLLTIAVSAHAPSPRLSLGLLSGLWLIGVLLLPRLAAEQAEQLFPTPQPSVFWADIKKAQSDGIDGHNPGDARAKQLEVDTLNKYGVQTLEELPISFAGLALQSGEEHGDQVFDHYFGALWSGYTAQAAFQRKLAWVAPVLAVRDLATHAAGTDVTHHERFAQAAEAHRRSLQVFLNGHMTANAKGKDFDYLAAPDFWATAPRFEYTLPMAHPSAAAATVLLGWLLLGVLACVIGTRQLGRSATA